MAQEQKNLPEAAEETTQDAVQSEEKTGGNSSEDSIFTGIYERLPDISIKAVDRFIVLCVIAFVAVILIGVLKANHIF